VSEKDLAPLAEDVRGLIERTRSSPVPSPGAQARVLASVEAIVGPVRGGGGHSPSGGTSRIPETPSTEGPRPRRQWPAAGTRAGRFGSLAASFVLGGVVGAAAMRAGYRPPVPAVVTTAQVPQAPAAPASPAASIGVAPPDEVPALVASRPRPRSISQDDLAAERAILDGARQALEREDGDAALSATADHQRRFPGGLLVQEREAMAIRALAMLGRMSEARARAERFRTHYPDSLLLPALESTIGQ
jgi:hypothetical protein